jgi:hypothetical protein
MLESPMFAFKDVLEFVNFILDFVVEVFRQENN